VNDEQWLAVANLHDVYLNATLQRSLRLAHGHASLVEAMSAPDVVESFSRSDYGRLERCWVAFLYVLVEAWVHSDTQPTIALIAEWTPLDEINQVLADGGYDGKELRFLKEDCPLAKMRSVRHYMAHRDRREYWDDGRHAVVGSLAYNERLHQAFGNVFLAVFPRLREAVSDR
jgi:hypothetical protein